MENEGEEYDKCSGNHTALSQIKILHCEQKNWNTKEDKGKSLMCTYCSWQKAHHEVMSSSEEVKYVALSIVKLRLAKGISPNYAALYDYKGYSLQKENHAKDHTLND